MYNVIIPLLFTAVFLAFYAGYICGYHSANQQGLKPAMQVLRETSWCPVVILICNTPWIISFLLP